MKQTLLIAIIVVFGACKKDPEPVDTTASIRVINHLETEIDILYLHETTTYYNGPIGDSLYYKEIDLLANDTSDSYSSEHVYNPLGFSIVIDFITYYAKYDSPNAIINPESPQLVKVILGGNYFFTVSSLDTINRTFNLELTNYISK